MAKNTKYVGASIPSEIADEMEKRATEEMRSVSSMYAVAAKEYLENVKEKSKQKRGL